MFIERVSLSCAPLKPWSDVINTPDLYGWFWIATTLIFSISVAGHFTSYLLSQADPDDLAQVFDMRKVTTAGGVVYGYISVIPFVLWLVLKWYETPLPLVDLLCLYGYSLTPFVPATVVCSIPSSFLTYLSLSFAFAVSSTHLFRHLWKVLQLTMPRHHTQSVLISITTCVVVLHFGFSCALKFLFLN
eukprot:c7462_g1_i4.p1 GENE.c7462_g1_i4~~c7462_g1_i4.p1  ORF type:complete len:188 (-),score=37.88 c7462_g1_i4:13-576(-)